MIGTDFQRMSFLPSPQLSSSQGTCYQPSAHNLPTVSKAVTASPPMSLGYPTSLMSLVQRLVPPTSPPVHHPANIPSMKVSFTYAHLMTVEQTSIWIWTFGAFRGWKEAPTYAENFKKNSITGSQLPKLNHELLKFELGISDSSHRLELLETVRQLFPSYWELVPRIVPSTPSNLSAMPETDTESDLLGKTISSAASAPSLTTPKLNAPQAEEYEACSEYLIKEQEDSMLMDISPQQSGSLISESGYSTSSAKWSSGVSSRSSAAYSLEFSESNLDRLPMARARARRSFIQPNVTLKDVTDDEQSLTKSGKATRRSYADLLKVRATASTICSSTSSEISCTTSVSNTETQNESLRSLVLTLPLNQYVRTGNIRNNFLRFKLLVRVEPLNKRSCWLIIFQSVEEAKRALSLQCELGYNLEPFGDNEPRKLMRPTPKNPIPYRVIQRVKIRKGKSLKGDIVGELYINKIVTINKIKGRRARIIETGFNGPKTVGWVSSHTAQGMPLLEQI